MAGWGWRTGRRGAPAQGEYDYVIVGAGSAGCVLANRLSADPGVTVLLLEAGGSDAHPLIQIPLGAARMRQRAMFDWKLHSEPEPRLHDRRIEAACGKVLGGSSSINMTSFTRGDPADFDRWALNGATGWSYRDVLPYFKKLETWAGGASALRGGSGPVGVEWTGNPDPLFDGWKAAFAEVGIPEIEDPACGMFGVSRAQCTVGGGRRASASNAYLKPVRGRPNLQVLTRVRATRVLFSGIRAAGIEYRAANGELRTVAARREVILSAGVYHSPHLLLLSGIGPAEQLRSHGIEVRSDLPVGRNLQDHVSVMIFHKRRGSGVVHRHLRFDRMAFAMLRAYFLRSGYATRMPIGVLAFAKTRPDLDAPDIEFMLPAAPLDPRLWFPVLRSAPADGFGIRCCLLHPRSRGQVRLQSSDPAVSPRIEFNFLSDPDDLAQLRAAFRLARDVASRTPLAPFREVESLPGVAVSDDAQIDDYIRRTLKTVDHSVGTCAMGTGDNAVLDPAFRVRGVKSLRVIDASAMPDLVSGQINAAVLMMAERGADMVISDWTSPAVGAGGDG